MCGFSPFTSACGTLVNRTVAVETDDLCRVAIYVLSDPKCSQSENLTQILG